MVVSDATKRKWAAQWKDKRFIDAVVQSVEAQKADPYAHSQLPYWLGLEVWERDEGLLVLAGIEPQTVDHETPFGGAWTNAMPFSEPRSIYQLPIPEDLTPMDFGHDEQSYELYLQERERRRSLLSKHQAIYEALKHRLEHSPSAIERHSFTGYRPVQFLAWASSIAFKPEWLDWATAKRLVPDPLEPSGEPFFDADSPDYPVLLHIAVRAWTYARKGSTGTPKQRVLAFLKKNYPTLPAGSRDAIAQVANWKPTGGRPKAK